MEEKIFEIIAHGGDARGYAFEALEAAQKGDYAAVEEALKKSSEELNLAHNTQTSLVQAELNGDKVELSLLMIHAQDQLMTAISEQNLIKQMIIMQKEINELKK